MRVDIILADFAETNQTNGKVALIGGGWSISGAGAAPMAVVVFIEVPWSETNQKRHWVLELFNADGAVVELPGPTGQPQPVSIDGDVEAGRPPGMAHGTPVTFPPLSLNVGPLPLPPGRYEWRFSVDGTSEETWRRTFTKLAPGGEKGQ